MIIGLWLWLWTASTPRFWLPSPVGLLMANSMRCLLPIWSPIEFALNLKRLCTRITRLRQQDPQPRSKTPNSRLRELKCRGAAELVRLSTTKAGWSRLDDNWKTNGEWNFQLNALCFVDKGTFLKVWLKSISYIITFTFHTIQVYFMTFIENNYLTT